MESLHKSIVCQVSIQENVSCFVSSTNVHGKGQYEHDHVNKVKGYYTDNNKQENPTAEVFSGVSTNTGKTNTNNRGYPGNARSVQSNVSLHIMSQ